MVLEYNTLYNSRFEELYKLQNANRGVLPLDDVEQKQKLKMVFKIHNGKTTGRQII